MLVERLIVLKDQLKKKNTLLVIIIPVVPFHYIQGLRHEHVLHNRLGGTEMID